MKYSPVKEQRVLKIIVYISIAFAFVSYTYPDIIATQRHGIEVWNALFSGNIRSYYTYCAEHLKSIPVYDFTEYFIFAIWNLPTWIFEKATGLDAQKNIWWLLYGKGLVLSFFFGCVYMFRKILTTVKGQENQEIRYIKKPEVQLMVSALFTVYSVYTGNYDVIALFFILWGILMLLNGRMVAFTCLFAIAFSTKFFALWLFIPIILVYEKKIWKLASYMLGVMVLFVLESLIFDKISVLRIYNLHEFSFRSVETIMNAGKVEITATGPSSLCIIAYALLCIWSYFGSAWKGKQEDVQKLFYVSFLSWLIFFGFIDFKSYWIVLFIPFLVYIATADKKKEGINLVLEMLLSACMYVVMNIQYHWIVGTLNTFNDISGNAGLIGEFFNWINGSLSPFFVIGRFLNEFNDRFDILTIFQSFVIALGIAMVVVNQPKHEPKFICTQKTIDLLYYVRFVMNLLVLVAPPIFFVLGQMFH